MRRTWNWNWQETFLWNLLGKTQILPPQMPRQRKGPRILRTDPIGLDTAACIEEGNSGINFPIFEKVRPLRGSFNDLSVSSWRISCFLAGKPSPWRTRRSMQCPGEHRSGGREGFGIVAWWAWVYIIGATDGWLGSCGPHCSCWSTEERIACWRGQSYGEISRG